MNLQTVTWIPFRQLPILTNTQPIVIGNPNPHIRDHTGKLKYWQDCLMLESEYVLKFILFETSCSFCRFIRFIAIQNTRSGRTSGRFVLILRGLPPRALVSSPAARFLNCRKMYEPRTKHKKSRKKRTLDRRRFLLVTFWRLKVRFIGKEIVD